MRERKQWELQRSVIVKRHPVEDFGEQKLLEAGDVVLENPHNILSDYIDNLVSQLAEYKQRAEAAEEKLRELEMQEPSVFLYGDEIHMVRPPASYPPIEYIALYAKPFPSKQEEK